MSHVFLDENYWQRHFLLSGAIVEKLHAILERAGSALTRELAEHAVRAALEEQLVAGGCRVYSPEQKYTAGELIFFQTREGPKFAEVLYVESGHSAPLQRGRAAYDSLCVRIKGEVTPRKYVSNCPALPLRFSDKLLLEDGDYLTPAKIVMRFETTISEALHLRLSQDLRFTELKDRWMITNRLVPLGEVQLTQAAQILRERGKATGSEIAKTIFPSAVNSAPHRNLAPSVSIALHSDREKRFLLLDSVEDFVWSLSPPPREVVMSITEDSLEGGYLPVGRELKRMLYFYGIGPIVTFKTHGEYEVRGTYDDQLSRITGDEVSNWLVENQIQTGHQVYLKAPEPGSSALRLYTLLESRDAWPTREREQETPERKRKLLRHQIYGVFLRKKQFLHYKEILDILIASGTHTDAGSVAAILSQNSHLFAKREPAKGLWGLSQWLSENFRADVSPTSLLIAIAEEGWVRKILEIEGAPLTAREIAHRLASLFVVRVEQVRELSFLTLENADLIQMTDDRWAIRTWVSNWSNRVDQLGEEMTRRLQVKRSIASLEKQIDAMKKETLKISETVAGLREQGREKELLAKQHADQISKIDKRLANLEPLLADKIYRSRLRTAAKRKLRLLLFAIFGISALAIAVWIDRIPDALLALGLCSASFGLLVRYLTKRMNAEIESLAVICDGVTRELEHLKGTKPALEALRDESAGAARRIRIEVDHMAKQEADKCKAMDYLRLQLEGLLGEFKTIDEAGMVSERQELLGLLENIIR